MNAALQLSTPERRRVLIVEDDAELSALISLHLRDLGCDSEVASDGTEGLQRARSGEFGLIILDWMLPGMDGLTVCQRLRQDEAYTPVLMLTAKSTELDRVTGLESGADDYLTKPFNILELNARVKAIFRRVAALSAASNPDSDAKAVQLGDLVITPSAREVTLDGSPINLTAREFDLLHFFAERPGRVFSRQTLLDHVWGYSHDGYEHTVNSHINRLRAKLERNPKHPRYIQTVWGAGYKMANDP